MEVGVVKATNEYWNGDSQKIKLPCHRLVDFTSPYSTLINPNHCEVSLGALHTTAVQVVRLCPNFVSESKEMGSYKILLPSQNDLLVGLKTLSQNDLHI